MQNTQNTDKNYDAKLAGAAKPLIFKDSKGVIYTLWPEPLSDKDNIELDAWVRAYYIFTVKSSLPEDATEEEKDRTERIAQETVSTLNWYSGHGIRIMASIEGMTQIMFMSVKKRNPEITVEKLRELLMDEQNLDAANQVFEELNLEGVIENKNPRNRGRIHSRTHKRKITKKKVKQRR